MGGAPLIDTNRELIEREQECAVLDALVDRLRDGGGTVVVRGEAGIGKSVLLQRVRGRAEAQGARPLVTVGVESEAEVAFAGLHQLLRPVIGALAQQPEPQRQVLEAALGLGVDHTPDPFRVAVAAFQLMCDVADSVPLVLIVDDAQWLDRSTLNVIAFIARRLEVEHVGLVAAIRREQAAPFDDARLPTIDLERLSASAAAHLLDREAPELHPVVRARVLAEASGNPLALVELASSMGRSGVQLSAPPTTLTARLDRAFANRLGELAPHTRAALLAAALDSRASLDEIARSSRAGVESLQPAVDADLVGIADDGVRFRHPLIRSAVRQAASAQQILEMHRALGEVVADPERRLWHRAMSAKGPDENIASALAGAGRTSIRVDAHEAADPGISRRGRDGHGDGGRRPPRAGSRRSRPSGIDWAGDPETGRANAAARDGRPGRGHVRGDGCREGRRCHNRSPVSCVRDRRPPGAGALGPSDAGSRALRVGGDPRGRVAGCRGGRSGGGQSRARHDAASIRSYR